MCVKHLPIFEVFICRYIYKKYALTILSIHLFNVVLIVLRIILVPAIVSGYVVHYWGSRFKGCSFVFARCTFTLSRIECRLFVSRDYAITSIIAIIRIRFRPGDRSSQFDKVLTRDAPNVCYFLHPLREGTARETYIRLPITYQSL